MRRFTRIVALLALLVSCSSVPSPDLPMGRWRAVLTTPGGELPFFIDFFKEGERIAARLINGMERVDVPETTIDGAMVSLRFPAFNNRIDAQFRDGQLTGTLTLTRRGGVEQLIPFSARPGQRFRFFDEKNAPNDHLGGKWDVRFFDDEDNENPAIGLFEQDGSHFYGSFLTPTGDYRYLDGWLKDSTVHLSCFDGAHAFLFRARLQADHSLTGHFWSGTQWHERWTAVRNKDAALPDPYTLTYLKDGAERLDFQFPDTDSQMVALSDARFHGKVVIVQIAGTWCPNCHDETRFLAEFHRENAERGLMVVGLMYEHYRDFRRAALQVNRFRQKYQIAYPLLVAGYSDKVAAAATLPSLNQVLSYPTTLFIDRQGRVRKIHTGFSGPGTGEYYQQLILEFKQFVETLLAENPA